SPSASGNSNFTVQVTDNSGSTDTQNLSIMVRAAVSITTSSLPTALMGSPYSRALAATGGMSPFQWSVASGSLPAGVAPSAGGTLSGTPSVAGDFTFAAQVTDSLGGTDTQSFTLTVTAPLAVTTASLPAGTVGTSYSQSVTANGGAGGYTWSRSAGSLPPGL